MKTVWIFKNDAFVSLVEDRDDEDYLWVRGRIPGDVERFLGLTGAEGFSVERTPNADYLFRLKVPRDVVAMAIVDGAKCIDYPNFKNSIPTGKAGDRRHDFYLKVWNAMMAYQRAVTPKSGFWYTGKKTAK